jgi:hypothetical protein
VKHLQVMMLSPFANVAMFGTKLELATDISGRNGVMFWGYF